MHKICKNCDHSEIDDFLDLRCFNPESDIEFTKDEDNDNYLDVVEENHTCSCFKDKNLNDCDDT
jgi:hypothetical protein